MQARNSSRLVSEGKRASGPVGGEGYDGGREDDATVDEVETTNSSLYTRTHAHTCRSCVIMFSCVVHTAISEPPQQAYPIKLMYHIY